MELGKPRNSRTSVGSRTKKPPSDGRTSFKEKCMDGKNPAAVALGKLGGSKTSEKKRLASIKNLEKARKAKPSPTKKRGNE